MNKSATDLISALVAAARGEVNPSWQLMTHPPRLRGRGWRGGVVAVRSSISARVGQELRRVMAYGVIIAPPPNEALEAAVRKPRAGVGWPWSLFSVPPKACRTIAHLRAALLSPRECECCCFAVTN